MGPEEEDIDVLGVWPVVKRYVLGTQGRRSVSGHRADMVGGAVGRGDASAGGPEIPFFFSSVFFLLRPFMLSSQD